jgi:hypothetical protein
MHAWIVDTVQQEKRDNGTQLSRSRPSKPFCEATIMPIEYYTSVQVAYCVEIETPADGGINWIKTLERLERFAESYGNEGGGGEGERSAKRVCTVPPSNSLFALAAQVVTIDNEDLQEALPSATKEDVEQIREIYPILVTAIYDEDEEEKEEKERDAFNDFWDQKGRFETATSKVLGKIIGHDDHGLKLICVGNSHNESGVVVKLVLIHDIRFRDSWGGFGSGGVEVNLVPLSLPSVEPTVRVSMVRVLSVLGMKAVDEPGWKVISDHIHEHF